jgi:arylsulfatase A-like enzyme
MALLAVAVLSATNCLAAEPARKPNIVVIYADDLGYADLSAAGCKDVRTPHIDSLARNGVRFANGYVSGCVCSPGRAGLLTGRYQQRFGFDANAEGERKNDKAPRALDLKQGTLAQRFGELGCATGLVGKWKNGPPAFGKEAEAFIDRHAQGPFFLYLAFTAVHAPHVAPEAYLKKFEQVADKRRQKYLAMIACLDDAVGGVLAKLRQHQLEESTLLFFSTDNGGPVNDHVRNGPDRGGKWSLWEGGIRSPIFIQWKGRLPAGRELPHPIHQLDFLPTALAAAGVGAKADGQFDGVNLLPLLEGKTRDAPHDALSWRFGIQYAVRQGDWKLVKRERKQAPKLFDLAADPGEKNDLAAKHPDKVKQLQALWDAWNAKNEPPRWTDERWNGLEERKATKKEKP